MRVHGGSVCVRVHGGRVCEGACRECVCVRVHTSSALQRRSHSRYHEMFPVQEGIQRWWSETSPTQTTPTADHTHILIHHIVMIGPAHSSYQGLHELPGSWLASEGDKVQVRPGVPHQGLQHKVLDHLVVLIRPGGGEQAGQSCWPRPLTPMTPPTCLPPRSTLSPVVPI